VKKLLVIAIAVIAAVSILVMSVPAMASGPDPDPTITIYPTVLPGVGTGVGISGGSGDEPIVKAKWETTCSQDSTAENGDPSHHCPGTQVYPPVSYGADQPICFWAVVADNPITDVSVVSVDVYHPDFGSCSPFDPTVLKFEVVLHPLNDALADGIITEAEATNALLAYNNAVLAGLVTINDAISPTDVTDELAQGEAYLWVGCYVLSYHQPWGCYYVDAFAIDAGPVAPESHLTNYFFYIPVTAFEIDFTSVNYGDITSNGTVSGDNIFGTCDHPTMRNLGNTWLHLEIQQDDMGFGFDSGSGTWNVNYDVRLGSLVEYPQGGAAGVPQYNPAGAKGVLTSPSPAGWTAIPGIVHLCNTWKLDFSIHILKAILPGYSGMMWLRGVFEMFSGPNISHPGSSLPAS
jgi:hypothetical protein